MSNLLSVAEVARRLQRPYMATLQLVKSTDCPFPVVRPTTVAGRYFVAAADLERYLADGTQQPIITTDVIRAAVRAELLDLLDPALLRRELRAVLRKAS